MKRRVFANQPRHDAAKAVAEKLGADLRAARVARRESQIAAAESVGTWQSALSRVEMGLSSKMSVSALLHLANRYGLAVQLVERDADVIRYRHEKEVATARRGQGELFTEAKAEYQRALDRSAARSA